jgi:DNA-binding transcriptional regulator LsrR (DeoR family)
MTLDCYKGYDNPHEPTEFTRGKVAGLYIAGIKKEDIAKRLNISDDTLRKYYKDELDHAKQDVQEGLVKILISKAYEGNMKAIMAWLTHQGKWYPEPAPKDINHQIESPFLKNANELDDKSSLK